MFLGIAAVAVFGLLGIVGIVYGVRKKTWSRGERIMVFIVGLLALSLAAYQTLILVYLANCTRPPNDCG